MVPLRSLFLLRFPPPRSLPSGGTALTAVAGPDGWPLKGGAAGEVDQKTLIWVVTDPTPHSTLPDIGFATTLDGFRLQFAGGLSMDDRPVVFTKAEDAHEEARNRLLVWRIARQIRIDRRVAENEIVPVTLQDKDGTVRFDGEVR